MYLLFRVPIAAVNTKSCFFRIQIPVQYLYLSIYTSLYFISMLLKNGPGMDYFSRIFNFFFNKKWTQNGFFFWLEPLRSIVEYVHRTVGCNNTARRSYKHKNTS